MNWMRRSKYSLLIICEGKNTEPLFFNSLKFEIKKGNYNIDIPDLNIEIRPEPKIEEILSKNVTKSARPEYMQRSARRAQPLREAIIQEPDEIKGVPPLKWVIAAQNELRDGTYNEVWVVFDHDNHPTRQQAFEKAKEEINNTRVNIAFSSRSFEYYLLLNFERIYNSFQKTECKTTGKNKKSLNCGTNKHEDDCKGDICINGYAAIKGYWNNSKGEESLYPLIKDKLQIGFENSAWLRLQSNFLDGGTPIYDRNPWLNSDELVKRLTGHFWYNLENNAFQLPYFNITLADRKLSIKNSTKNTLIIPQGSITYVTAKGIRKKMGSRINLFVDNEELIDLGEINPKDGDYFIFSYDTANVMFSVI